MSLLNHPDPNAVSTASVSFRIVHDDDDKVDQPLLEAAAEALMSPPPAAASASTAEAPHSPSPVRKASSRKPIVLLDASGQEKTYGSALGALTRKFVDIIQASHSGSVDMNETATFLKVPKRRIYDITNVLEGVGILEKRSKNTVAWKGSEAILGASLDPEVKEELETLRREISLYLNEESMLDQWIQQLGKNNATNTTSINARDIVGALYYPAGLPPPTRDELLDNDNGSMGKPKHSLLAIHAPSESIIQIPAPDYDGQVQGQLFVGTKDALRLGGDEESAKRRKLSYEGRIGVKSSRSDESKVEVYNLSTYFDEKDQKVDLAEMKLLCHDVKERTSSWDLAESLANDEGVSDFMVAAEDDAV